MIGHYRKKSTATENHEEFGILCSLKTRSQGAEI